MHTKIVPSDPTLWDVISMNYVFLDNIHVFLFFFPGNILSLVINNSYKNVDLSSSFLWYVALFHEHPCLSWSSKLLLFLLSWTWIKSCEARSFDHYLRNSMCSLCFFRSSTHFTAPPKNSLYPDHTAYSSRE